MKSGHNSRIAAGAPGIKMLITAGALAATLGGWATLTARDIPAEADAPPGPAVMMSVAQPAPGPSSGAQQSLRVVNVPAGSVGPGAPVTVTQSSR